MDTHNLANNADDARTKIEELLDFIRENKDEIDLAIEDLGNIAASAENASQKIDQFIADLGRLNR